MKKVGGWAAHVTGHDCFSLGEVVMFNLPPPTGFRGLIEWKPLTVYSRNLPHWRQQGATYFVTFRLADSLPQDHLEYLKRLKLEWERTHPPPQSDIDWEKHLQELVNVVERWSDAGLGECWFQKPKWVAELKSRLFHFQNVRYHLSCYVIMPNHCHLVIRPFDDYALEDILQGIKSMTARAINRVHGRSGPLWQEESFDRIIRDEEHLWRVIQYIGANPSRAGLPVNRWYRWVDPEWNALGWRFIEVL